VKVLLVDDLPDARFILRKRLERENLFEIVGEASNGQEALDLAEQHSPDVVIMDFRMPVMDGVEATRLLKQKFPEIQVIGFTAYEDPEMRKSMLEAGASHNVTKTEIHNLVDLLRGRISA
jgi:two-component system nitrate/nitrite response regulator NarL